MSYHKLLTNLASSSRTGEYWPSVVLYGPRCARSVLPRPRANIPRYGPRARLVRGCYYMVKWSSGKSERSVWFFLGQDFALYGPFHKLRFFFLRKSANSKFATKTKKRKQWCKYSHSSQRIYLKDKAYNKDEEDEYSRSEFYYPEDPETSTVEKLIQAPEKAQGP